MTIDWEAKIRSLVDLGSVSYEERVTRTALRVGAIALFVIVAWALIRRT
jgi:hypothetical protein